MKKNMEQTVQKFLLFLENRIKQKIDGVSDDNKKEITIAGKRKYKVIHVEEDRLSLLQELRELENFLNLFMTKKETWIKNRLLCCDFDLLSDLLAESNLTEKECAQLIFFLVERNIAGKFLECAPVTLDSNTLKTHEFKTFTPENLVENAYVDEDGEMCLKLTEEQQQEFDDVASKCTINLENAQQAHYILNEHFFKKRNNYTAEDVELILEALKMLNVNEKILNSVNIVLDKELKIRYSKEKKLIDKKNKLKQISSNKNFVTNNTEYRQTWEQLRDIIDLREMMPKSCLNLEETLKCVTMMFRLGIKREEIRKFLWNLEIENIKVEINPVTKYLENYKKLEFYAKKLVLYNELDNLEEYFQSLFIADDEEYVFWTNCLAEDLEKYLKKIPGGYEYEIETALMKVKKRQ